jgi:hypothetical protein
VPVTTRADESTLVTTIHTDDGWCTHTDSGCLVGMDDQESSNRRVYGAALGVIGFLSLYQGVVPLVVRLLFHRGQHFAPALRLPSPWWWIACLAVMATTGAALAMIYDARQRRIPAKPEPASVPPSTPDSSIHAMNRTRAYDTASAVVFLIGIYNGVAPFIARFVFGGNLLLALPMRLPSPWWWITSTAVIVAAFALLVMIDQAKERRRPDD